MVSVEWFGQTLPQAQGWASSDVCDHWIRGHHLCDLWATDLCIYINSCWSPIYPAQQPSPCVPCRLGASARAQTTFLWNYYSAPPFLDSAPKLNPPLGVVRGNSYTPAGRAVFLAVFHINKVLSKNSTPRYFVLLLYVLKTNWKR